MAMLQKRLYETSQQPRHAPTITVTEGFHAQNHRHAPSSSAANHIFKIRHSHAESEQSSSSLVEPEYTHGHLSVATSASVNGTSVRRAMLNRVESDYGGGGEDRADIVSVSGQKNLSKPENIHMYQSSDNIRREIDSSTGSHPLLMTPSQSVTAIMSGSQLAINQNYSIHQPQSILGNSGIDDAIGPLAMLNRKLCDNEDQMA